MRIKKIPGPLKGQLQRAASSVVLNLAEGWGRATPADRRRFFQIAFGSHREIQAIIQLEPDEFNEEERDTSASSNSYAIPGALTATRYAGFAAMPKSDIT